MSKHIIPWLRLALHLLTQHLNYSALPPARLSVTGTATLDVV